MKDPAIEDTRKKTEDRCAARRKIAALQDGRQEMRCVFFLSSVLCLAAQRSSVFFFRLGFRAFPTPP
jgi:hypothetical protein